MSMAGLRSAWRPALPGEGQGLSSVTHPTSAQKKRPDENKAAFPPRLRYYMTSNILWTVHALFQGSQAGNPRPDREEGFGAAAREGRTWHRRRRSHEGGRPDPWRFLRAFRFPGSPGDRGVRLRDGPFDRALAQARRTNPAGQALRRDRRELSHACPSRRSG